MVNSGMTKCFVCVWTFTILAITQAMFFTDSKENDYPRIGKRPKSMAPRVYKGWLERNDGLATDTRNSMDDLKLKSAYHLWDIDSNGQTESKNMVSPNTRRALEALQTLSTGLTPADKEALVQLIWSYINTDTDDMDL